MTKKHIEEGNIIYPFSKSLPIQTFRQPEDGDKKDLFIRARHSSTVMPSRKGHMWFSQSWNGIDDNPALPSVERAQGLIIFVPRPLNVGECVEVVKVFKSGDAARGRIITVPASSYVSMLEASMINDLS